MKTFFILLSVIVITSCNCDEFKSKSCAFTLEASDGQAITNCKCKNFSSASNFGCVRELWRCRATTDRDYEECDYYGIEKFKPTDVCLEGGSVRLDFDVTVVE